MKKQTEVDLSHVKTIDINELREALVYKPQGEIPDVITGEVFYAQSRNHYETNSGVPVAPAVDLPRPTLRQRVEFLTRTQPDILARYVHDGSSDSDYEIPDDPDSPLTPSEMNYVDQVAQQLAEAAPLPDEGLSGAPLQRAPEPAETPVQPTTPPVSQS